MSHVDSPFAASCLRLTQVQQLAGPFCGGEAHAGMSIMTERLWELVADNVLKALDENVGYELILAGHSLGAGTALLLNILLHHDDRFKQRKFCAFAYASPPVYFPLSQVPKACQTAVNYMHDNDDVPLTIIPQDMNVPLQTS